MNDFHLPLKLVEFYHHVSFVLLGERLGYVTLLLLLYGWAIIPLVYLTSFIFSVPSTAFIRLTIFNVITGLATLLTVFILSIPSLDLLDVADALKWVFLFLPNYALGQAINDMFTNHQYLDLFNKGVAMCVKLKNPKAMCEVFIRLILKNSPNKIVYQENYLAWDNPGIGRFLIFLAWEGLFFFLLVLFIEYGGFSAIFRHTGMVRKPSITNGATKPIDEDVAIESRRIEARSFTDDVLLLENVTKFYGKFSEWNFYLLMFFLFIKYYEFLLLPFLTRIRPSPVLGARDFICTYSFLFKKF